MPILVRVSEGARPANCRTKSLDVSDARADDGMTRTVTKSVVCRLVSEVEGVLRAKGVVQSVLKEDSETPVSAVPDETLRLLLAAFVREHFLMETAPKPDHVKRREREQKRRETASRRRERDRQEKVRAKILPHAPGMGTPKSMSQQK